jgi:outer membrane protein assembly factor BamB
MPERLPSAAEISINCVSIAGQAVTQGWVLPARVRAATSVRPHLSLRAPKIGFYTLISPAVSATGDLYIPQIDSTHVLVFDNTGAPLPGIDVTALGLSRKTIAAAVCDVSGTLFLTEENGEHSVLVALDLSTRAIRWRSPPGLTGCRGLATLSDKGVLIAACHGDSKLRVFRITDGHLLSSFSLQSVTDHMNEAKPVNAAYDALSGTIFVSLNRRVWSFSWDGSAIHSHGALSGTEDGRNYRSLAVVPPAVGRCTSHLVVGTWGSQELRVLSLPDMKLVYTTELSTAGDERMRAHGLAADRTGTTLILCDDGGVVYTLPWPLQGMPALL